jgi:hypothetical protein
MADDDLHAFGNLAGVPCLALRGRNGSFEHCRPNARTRQDLADPGGNVVCFGVNSKDVTQPALGQLSANDAEQFPLFGVKAVLREVLGLGNDELFPVPVLNSSFSPNLAQSERTIRVQKQRVQHFADSERLSTLNMLQQSPSNHRLP